MKHLMRGVVCSGACLAGISDLGAAPGASQEAALAERGKYIVEGLGICAHCHTPHEEDGSFDTSRWLKGTVLDFQPFRTIIAWARLLPPLAGLPGMKETEVLQLLQTGLTAEGKYLRPPMLQYRMSRSDAEAVVAYLKTLGTPWK